MPAACCLHARPRPRRAGKPLLGWEVFPLQLDDVGRLVASMTEAIARHAQLYPHWDAEPEPIAESSPEPTEQPTAPEAAESIAPTDSTESSESSESTAAQASPEAIAPETPDNPAAAEPAAKPEPAPAPKAPIRLVDLKPKPSRAPESDA